tara:strand:+ start:172 stop:534 length:363 start_codon:yes stop_codon:yes gene_type:complete
MEVLLDTNFIISCVKKRIDFLGDLEGFGLKVVVPKEVFEELKDFKKGSKGDRTAANVALDLFEQNKVKKTALGGRSVDSGLISKGKLGVYIATLDNGVKRAVPNKVVISGAKNSLVIERN